MTALRIGLTGGIGSGKSTVGAMLASLGAVVIDTDLIARRLTMPGGAALGAIAAAFGSGFIAADGGLDRPLMRRAAFDDATIRIRLEAILHPLIGVEVEREAALAAAAPVLVSTCRCWSNRADGAAASTRSGWSIATRPCRSPASRRGPAGARTRRGR
jgi:dephospho-CoA kinase